MDAVAIISRLQDVLARNLPEDGLRHEIGMSLSPLARPPTPVADSVATMQ